MGMQSMHGMQSMRGMHGKVRQLGPTWRVTNTPAISPVEALVCRQGRAAGASRGHS